VPRRAQQMSPQYFAAIKRIFEISIRCGVHSQRKRPLRCVKFLRLYCAEPTHYVGWTLEARRR